MMSTSGRLGGIGVGGIGLLGLGVLAGTLSAWLPALASGSEHRAGDAGLVVMLAGLPAGLAGLVAIRGGIRLWRADPGAALIGWLTVIVAAGLTVNALTGFGSSLWALRVIVTEPGRWWIEGTRFVYDPVGLSAIGTPSSRLPWASLVDPWFWSPLALAVLAIIGTVGLVGLARRR